MAFVSCDSRWKESIDCSIPGPGEYEVSRGQTPEKKQSSHSHHHHRSPNFKRNNDPSASKAEDPNMAVKTWYSQEHTPIIIDPTVDRKPSQKKGKLYRKNISQNIHRSISPSEAQCVLQIKNGQKSYSNAIDRDKWGNMRILELLKEHEKEKKRNPLKKCSTFTKRNVFTNQMRQKLQTDLKQMEILFNSQRNRNDQTMSLKNLNRQISSQQKQREQNSHNYFLTVNRAKTGVQIQGFQEEFTIQPSGIYRSPHDQTFISRPQTIFGQSQIQSVDHSKLVLKQQSIPTATGISDDLMQDSMEYIDDATPGPGSYNLDISSASNILRKEGKKIEKFGVTMQRFKVHRDTNQQQTFINPAYPTFKKSTHAKQEEVGFGRSTKTQKEPEPCHSGVYYEDLSNLQNISKKTLLKPKNKKVGFESCKERFSYGSKKKQWYQQQEDNIEQEQEEESQEVKIPTSVFLSKVQRELPVAQTITEKVDFTGQNYSCIAHKLKKQQEFYQDYEIKPAPFMTKDNRFKYEELKKEEQLEQLKLVKIKELKEKKQKKKGKTNKGFTFGREMKKDSQPTDCPPPDKYELEPEWIKKSYNLRFR